MSQRTLRICGWLLVAAAGISIVSTILGFVIPGPSGPSGPPSTVSSILDLIAGVLFLIGIPAGYLTQSQQIGRLGLIGIIALWLTAFLFDIVFSIIALTSPPSNLTVQPPPALLAFFIIGTLLEAIGGVLFGLKTIQAKVFSGVIGWLLIIAAVLAVIAFPLPDGPLSDVVNTLSNVLLFIGLGWLGYLIANYAAKRTSEPAPSITETPADPATESN